jgi:hypothetical protein
MWVYGTINLINVNAREGQKIKSGPVINYTIAAIAASWEGWGFQKGKQSEREPISEGENRAKNKMALPGGNRLRFAGSGAD